MGESRNMLPAHNATDPKCRCCSVVIEYSSEGYRWGLCISCSSATEGFIHRRREVFKSRGLIK